MIKQQAAEHFLKRLEEACNGGFPQMALALKAAIMKKNQEK